MRTLTLIVLFPALVGCANQASASSCATLDADCRKAVQYFVDDAGNRSGAPVDDNEELRWAAAKLRGAGPKAVPCLLEIYRVGPGPAGFWTADGEAPKVAPWALPLIRDLDPKAALPLYRDLRASATDELSRMHYAAELAFAGDRQVLDELVDFLSSPPVVAEDRRRDLVVVQERILDAVSVNNYKPAVPVLRRMAESWAYPNLVRVTIAQLTDDSTVLEQLASAPTTARPALLALIRAGDQNRVKEIAANRSHPSQAMAQALLRDPTTR